MIMRNKLFAIISILICCHAANAQQVLSLQDCKRLALQNNKQLNMAKLKQDAAQNMQKVARTKYLPKIDAVAGYELTSREISILNNKQKSTLSNIGTNSSAIIGNKTGEVVTNLVQQGLITPEAAGQMGEMLQNVLGPLSQFGNEIGNNIVDAFRTDTRNIWAGSVMLRQPIYMGGAITAANKMADLSIEMASNDMDVRRQQAIYDVESAYWLVVSLRQKQILAYSYRDLVKKLNEDVHKMIDEGVATKADGLKVDVKENEAEIQIVQVDDGVSLAKMLLCQLCGLPMDSEIILEDEAFDENKLPKGIDYATSKDVYERRPELRLLQNAIDMSQQATKLIKAANRPQVALTGGYLISNPNTFNGFERKFGGVWNVGILLRVPVWNWFEGRYKTNAAKAATTIACLELEDIGEKVELQITQCKFKLEESIKKCNMTRKNIESAEENLRCANVGFQEGVIDATDVMAAQTAWQQAKTQHIDAQIENQIAILNLMKANGEL